MQQTYDLPDNNLQQPIYFPGTYLLLPIIGFLMIHNHVFVLFGIFEVMNMLRWIFDYFTHIPLGCIYRMIIQSDKQHHKEATMLPI